MGLVLGVGEGTFTLAVLWALVALVIILARTSPRFSFVFFACWCDNCRVICVVTVFCAGIVTIGLAFAPRESTGPALPERVINKLMWFFFFLLTSEAHRLHFGGADNPSHLLLHICSRRAPSDSLYALYGASSAQEHLTNTLHVVS